MKTGGRSKVMIVYVVSILIVVITLFPIYWMFVVSARSRIELFMRPKLYQSSFFSQNYYRPFFQDVFGRYFINSLIVASGNTGLVLLLAFLTSYAFSRLKIRGMGGLFFWTITNRMAPPAVFIIPLYLMFSKIRLVDTHIGLILLYCVFNLPFAIWLLKGTIDGIPIELDEAASIDGCSIFSIMWRIILPVAKPGIATTAIMIWIFSWNEYLFASILTRVNARTITTGLSEFVTVVGTNWGEMAAVSVISLLPAILLIGFIQKYIITGLTFGAVKE